MITRVTIDGMMCQHCVRAVFTALGGVEGVERAEVGIGWAEVTHSGGVTLEQIAEAVAVVGYRAVGAAKRRELKVV